MGDLSFKSISVDEGLILIDLACLKRSRKRCEIVIVLRVMVRMRLILVLSKIFGHVKGGFVEFLCRFSPKW